MMKSLIVACSLLVGTMSPSIVAFSPMMAGTHRSSVTASKLLAQSAGEDMDMFHSSEEAVMDRRNMLMKGTAAGMMAMGVLTNTGGNMAAFAEEEVVGSAKKPRVVVVAGATGQTGRRILERLAGDAGKDSWDAVIGGVRNVAKASSSLSESSTVIRGAMVQNVPSIDTNKVQLSKLDVVTDSEDAIVDSVFSGGNGAVDALVIAVGFVPGNPLKMGAAAHAVDNVGTIKLIDAAKKAGVKKVVMVSSILTNGRNWGQADSPGFVITNAFGQVLDEKIVAENYLRASGLDYTIVRPGGLKAKPPTGELLISKEDTLNSGEISRDLVADVCVASLTDTKASNKVLEIIEQDGTAPKVFNGLVM